MTTDTWLAAWHADTTDAATPLFDETVAHLGYPSLLAS